jgi:hypothetical protein
MPSSRHIHVLAYGHSRWAVRRDGQVRELSLHAGHAEAEQAARVQARIDAAPLVVHSPAGTRQEFPAEHRAAECGAPPAPADTVHEL